MWPEEEEPQGRDVFSRPADVLAERIVAGSVMARPDLIDELAADFDPADFTEQRCAWIWHAVDEIRNSLTDGKIPWHEVSIQLKKWQAEKYLPIVPYDDVELSRVYMEAEPASAAWYAGRINRIAERNRTLDLSARARTLALSPSFDRDRDLAALQQQFDAIIRGQAGNTPRPLADLLGDALERAVTPRTNENRIPTGLADLDALTGGGFSPGRLIIIGARPGVGKTTVGQGFARAAAITNKIPTLFTSLEMGEDEILEGILAAECRVPLNHINTGTTSDADAFRLAKAAGRLAEAPLYVDDATDVSLPSLRGQVRNLVRTVGLRMVVVDYLQLMQAPKAESRQVAVSALSRGLKLMAKEFGITVVVLCQLNRASEQRSDKRPTIADLRESGAIEQDADMVILLNRPDMYEPESHRAGEADLIVDKHRGGQRTTITAAWQGHYARIFDMAYTPSTPQQQEAA
ncbi:DnaB-like helicase C-terminal domain-containing protein [Streptomyces sp. NPDC046237]|uniref:DnaB-like helicase C-terminal domain-containing protein n=1 Tax=Streptomyces sp. NPDC046237 TaxID=3154914 RepID=UPI003407BDD9